MSSSTSWSGRHSTNSPDSWIGRVASNIDQSVAASNIDQSVATHLENAQVDQYKRLAVSFINIAHLLMNTNPKNQDDSRHHSNSMPYKGGNLNEQDELPKLDDRTIPASRFYMRPRHTTSLSDLIAEWFGTGIYHDDYGGISGRNKLNGSKWRKHFPSQQYSRTKRIVLTVEKLVKDKATLPTIG